MKEFSRMLAVIFGAPHTMTPDEIEDRVEMLEGKVEANKVALEQHEKNLHPKVPRADGLDQ